MPELTRKRTPRTNIVFAFALALAAWVAWLAHDAILLLYVSALFAVVLMPVVRAVERWHIRRWRPGRAASVAIILLAVAAGLTGFGFLAIPPVARDLEQLSSQAPNIPTLIDKLHSIPYLDRLNYQQLSTRVEGWVSHAAAYIMLSAKDWAGSLADLVTGLVLTIYFILEGDIAYGWFLSFVPPQQRARLDPTLRRAAARMGRWLLGQASLMLILGLSSTTVYALLHVRYAYALGVLTGLLNIIPVLGAAITIALVLIIAAFTSWKSALGVAIFYVIYIQIENSFLTPRIMHNRVNLPGLAILVGLLFGFSLAGVLGALVAVPTTVLVAELLDEYLVWKNPPFSGPP